MMINSTGWLQRALCVVASIVALAALPAAADGQVGAIGAAPGSATGESGEATPILAESALQLGRGEWALSAFAGLTGGSVSTFNGFSVVEVDYSYRQLLVGGFYAPSDRFMVGFLAAPYASVSFESEFGDVEDSGRGDASLYGKVSLWRGSSSDTRVAGFGSLSLPIGDDVHGAAGTSLGLGLALTHRLPTLSLHGAFSLHLPTDEADGETGMGFTGAAVFPLSPQISLSGEAILSLSGGENSIDIAPGARVRLGNGIHLNAALLLNASNSLDVSPYDQAFVIGATIAR